MTATMTPARRKALEALRAMPRPFLVDVLAGHVPVIRTGLSTAVLHGLRATGDLSASAIYLGGAVSPDLLVLDANGDWR